MENTTHLMTILQLSDSGELSGHRSTYTQDTAFLSIYNPIWTYPTGGFSHSLGYESASKHKVVVSRGDFEKFIIATLENAGSQGIPFVKEAYNFHHDSTVIKDLDTKCHVCLSNHVANRASRRQGRSILDTSSKTFSDQPRLQEIYNDIDEDLIHGHFPVMFGALCGVLGLDLPSVLTMFLFTTLKTVVASSVRLGAFGPIEAQKIQNGMQKLIPEIINRSEDLTIDDIHIRYPLVDLLQNVHDTMFSKLFYS